MMNLMSYTLQPSVGAIYYLGYPSRESQLLSNGLEFFIVAWHNCCVVQAVWICTTPKEMSEQAFDEGPHHCLKGRGGKGGRNVRVVRMMEECQEYITASWRWGGGIPEDSLLS